MAKAKTLEALTAQATTAAENANKATGLLQGFLAKLTNRRDEVSNPSQEVQDQLIARAKTIKDETEKRLGSLPDVKPFVAAKHEGELDNAVADNQAINAAVTRVEQYLKSIAGKHAEHVTTFPLPVNKIEMQKRLQQRGEYIRTSRAEYPDAGMETHTFGAPTVQNYVLINNQHQHGDKDSLNASNATYQLKLALQALKLPEGTIPDRQTTFDSEPDIRIDFDKCDAQHIAAIVKTLNDFPATHERAAYLERLQQDYTKAKETFAQVRELGVDINTRTFEQEMDKGIKAIEELFPKTKIR